jgi:hypothetical protein
MENHTNSPDLAATDWPLQEPWYHLGDHKYKENREVEPVVTQCLVFLTEERNSINKQQKISPCHAINTSGVVRATWKGVG